jgi:hypothetical protein
VRNGSFVAFGAIVACVACEQPGERPDPITCSGCGSPITPTWTGDAPSDVDGGAAGSGSGSDEPVTLEGEVHILNDIAALTSTRYDLPAALRAEGTNGDVLGQWDGVGPFSIEGVKRAGAVWAQATPTSGDTLRALRPINTSLPRDGVVTTALGLARSSDFQAAFDLLGSPIDFAENAGHALLIAVSGGDPISGARVVASRDGVVLYSENGAYSDTATSTDESGIVLLANVPAGDWPGSEVTVTLGGSGRGSFILMLVSGGLTIANVGN